MFATIAALLVGGALGWVLARGDQNRTSVVIWVALFVGLPIYLWLWLAVSLPAAIVFVIGDLLAYTTTKAMLWRHLPSMLGRSFPTRVVLSLFADRRLRFEAAAERAELAEQSERAD